MNPKWKPFIIGGMILTAILGFAFVSHAQTVARRRREEESKDFKPSGEPMPNIPNTSEGVENSTLENRFPLKKGSRGNEVANLQNFLNVFLAESLMRDGKFGTKTGEALNRNLQMKEVDYPTYVKMMNYGKKASTGALSALGRKALITMLKGK